MPRDRFGETWPGATYNGFSGPRAERPQARPWRPTRGALIGGLTCAAIALGLAAGFAFRPDHSALSPDDAAEARVTQHMPIEVTRPAPPPPLPRPAGKLEVLNPATAEAARAAQPAWASAPASPPPVRDVSAQVAAPMVVVPRPAAPAAPPLVNVPRSPPEACAARSRAEALVCADPQLAGLDRDLNRAYGRALRSGAVSPQDLRADQRDWLDDRERAARRSPEAMGDLYQQRIDELNRIADDGPGD